MRAKVRKRERLRTGFGRSSRNVLTSRPVPTSAAAIMDRDRERPDQRREDRVVDDARWQDGANGSATGIGDRRALKRSEQGSSSRTG